jgi:hypothetical protein
MPSFETLTFFHCDDDDDDEPTMIRVVSDDINRLASVSIRAT